MEFGERVVYTLHVCMYVCTSELYIVRNKNKIARETMCCLVSNILFYLLHFYTRKNAQVVTNMQQTCSNAVPTTCQHSTGCVRTACSRLVDKLSTAC